MEKTILENQVIIMMALIEQVKDAAIKKNLLYRIRFTETQIKNMV